MNIILSLYGLVLINLVAYSYTFVDQNLPISLRFTISPFFSTVLFIGAVVLLSFFHFYFLWLITKKKVQKKTVFFLVIASALLLFFAYPAFSYDIFNYIFTAKVAFLYGENPYLIMPIDFTNDPNIVFTRAANKIALYGPSWILISAIPHFLGFQNLIATIFAFKLTIVFFYAATILLLWKLSKNILTIGLFALCPLVLIETLVSAHNDIVMMFFALLAFYFLKRNLVLIAIVSLSVSILVKYATLFLVPVFLYVIYLRLKNKQIVWDKIYYFSTIAMLVALSATPIREEIYPWYVIWALTFVVLIPKRTFLISLVLALTAGTLLRYVPVLYTGSYGGITPLVKNIVTFIPLMGVTLYAIKKKF